MEKRKKIILNLEPIEDLVVNINQLVPREIPGAVEKFVSNTKCYFEKEGFHISNQQLIELKRHIKNIILNQQKKEDDLKNG